MAKITVTGGSGFIGSHIVDRLIKDGHEVSVFDFRTPPNTSARFLEGDLLNFEDVGRAVKGAEFVFHIAAFADITKVAGRPLETVSTNVLGTANVLEACVRNNVKRVFYASSVYVYGQEGNLYTTTKLAGELLCKDYQKIYGLSYTILRLGTAYGPRSRGADVISVFVDRALRKEPLKVAGDGKQYRNFIYVEDIAEGFAVALSKKAENRTYDITGAESVSINRLVDIIRQEINAKVRIEKVPARADEYSGKFGNPERMLELGWRPRTDIITGIKKHRDWLVSLHG